MYEKMRQMADILYGNEDNIFFKLNLKFLFIRSLTYYYKLGQLAGFTICNSGRGPDWNLLESNSIPEIDGLELKFVLEK